MHLQKSIGQTCSRISFTFLSVLVDKTRIDDFYELENVLEENIEATFDAWVRDAISVRIEIEPINDAKIVNGVFIKYAVL